MIYLFIYLGFYVALNTVQVISQWVVGRAEETSTCSSLGFCTVNCRPTASNYQLSHLRQCREPNPGLRGGRRECYHSATVAPDSSDRGKTPKKSKKSSHKSPSKKISKASKATDFQSEGFARLKVMFLARSFSVPVEPVQKQDVVVSDRPFIPPVQQITSQKASSSATGHLEMKKSVKSESTCLAPRATAIKGRGFSEAAQIEAPQRGSTKAVYEVKWTIFTQWCRSNQVDFRAPPLKAIDDFLMYLFQYRKLQPGTIDGYRSAIADINGGIPQFDENLTLLLDSFYRDRPKGRRGIPSWNLSLVFHQLTKAPFEPLKDASLKHLTFKTVFLLALGSGKRRCEIHSWLHNIRHQSDWSKVSLYPSPSFLSKNQLAKEGPDIVSPVVILVLTPTLDKSLKGDRSLCPVTALRYYLDRTSDLRQNKELVFVSFKKGFDKDISPVTVSSWIKQTVILCYELSDQ